MTVPVSEDIFGGQFKDPEDTMALHRFLWLLSLLKNHPDMGTVDFGLKCIKNWVCLFPEPTDNIMFESYSICERLVNWLFFIMFIDGTQRPGASLRSQIAQSIEKQLLWLVKHLEYHGNQTNNHILNNARALYICGGLLHLNDVAELGRCIYLAETDEMIINGELQEGSSHYQMLITSWYLEIYLIAMATGDGSFADWIEPRLSEMLGVCALLQSKYQSGEFSLSGDISPDLPPSCFTGYPFSACNPDRSQWYQMVSRCDSHSLTSFCSSISGVCRQHAGLHSGNMWYYIEQNGIEVWVIGYNGRNKRHGHNDNGSIAVFFRGKPVIVDLGLIDYRREETARKQAGWQGHNVPLVNGMPPDIDKYSYLRDSGMCSCFKLIARNDCCIEYSVIYAMKTCELMRKVELKGVKLFVEDRIISRKKTNSVLINWHFADAVHSHSKDKGESRYVIDNNLLVRFSRRHEAASCKQFVSTCSKQYGLLKKVNTIAFKTEVKSGESLVMALDFSGVGGHAS